MVRRIVVILLCLWAALARAAPAPVLVADIEGGIGPATVEFVSTAIDRAARDKAQLLVLRMDTPGGLDSSMRAIIKAILASPGPVATFVAPEGARAASAGTYIAYASHFAAMAPGTAIGAATPIALGGGLAPPEPREPKEGKEGAKGKPAATPSEAKAVNDAAAYIRGLAQLRGRNAEWAEKAVREAASLAAHEAARDGVIDVMAGDVPALLAALDGRESKTPAGSRRLETRDAPTVQVEAGWRTRLLQVIADPSVALILMMIGFYGLVLEFASPGFGVPGTVGAICLLLGLFALQLLPVSYAGLGLILLGVALMVAEGLAPSFGILGAGGALAFVLGGILLVREEQAPGFEVPLGLLAGLAVTSAVLTVVAVRFALRSRRLPVRSGVSTLVGAEATVLELAGGTTWASVRGERWQVRSSAALSPGDAVRVTGIHGLVLEVERAAPSKGD